MRLRELYDAIQDLQFILQTEVDAGQDLFNRATDYRDIKALAATYELQEYLANRIAASVDAGLLDPNPED